MSVVYTAPDPAILGPALSGTVPAPVGRRIGAALLDGVLLALVELAAFGFARYVLWGFAFAVWFPVYRAATSIFGYGFVDVVLGPAGFTAIIVLVWASVQWRLHATTGQTVGKRAVGVRTLAVPAGTVPGWGRTLGRYLLLGFADLFCLGGLLFVLSVFWDRDRLLRGWHDKAANVFLIDIRAGRDPQAVRAAGAMAPATMPSAPPVAAVPVTPAVAALPDPVGAPPASSPAATLAVLPPAGSARPASGAPADGIISAVPGLSAPARGVGALPPPPPPPPAPSDLAVPEPALPFSPVPSPPPVALPFSPLPAPPVDDDAEMTVMSLDATAPVTEVRVVFDTGAVLPVTGRGRIGRDPVGGDEPLSHLVPLADTTKSVSKTHLEFALGDGGLWVCDLHSTNGSSIEHSGRRTALPAGEWVCAAPGAVVHLGSRTFQVEAS